MNLFYNKEGVGTLHFKLNQQMGLLNEIKNNVVAIKHENQIVDLIFSIFQKYIQLIVRVIN